MDVPLSVLIEFWRFKQFADEVEEESSFMTRATVDLTKQYYVDLIV